MIEFLTLFLHLMSGIQPVEVAVTPEVAVVEFVLDGETVTTLKAPPWRADVDFGALGYHALQAIALASDGSELMRISQQINLPRSPVEARITIGQSADGTSSKAQVVWNAITNIKPVRIDMRLDGKVIKADRSGSFPLPQIDIDNAENHHMLVAEVHFAGGISTTAEIVLGGHYGSELQTGLTAVPITSDHVPDLQVVAKRILVDAKPAQIVAIEQTGTRIAVVQDPETHSALSRLARMQDGHEEPGFPRVQLVSEKKIKSGSDLLSLIHPCGKPRTTQDGSRVLFPIVGPLALKPKPLPWLIAHARFEGYPNRPRKCADAVATAALKVAASTHPRAVILILGNDAPDTSQYTATEVRTFLDSIHVPLYVWRTEMAQKESLWASGQYISSPKKLRQAAAIVQNDLAKQWIVWIEGHLTPNRIQVTGAAKN